MPYPFLPFCFALPAPPAGGCFDFTEPGGFLSERVPFYFDSMWGLPAPTPQAFAGVTHPRAPGLLCPRRQSNQNAAGDTPAPVLPNRTPAKEHCAATETPRFGWSLVISAVIILLRLACARMGTALGMTGTSY